MLQEVAACGPTEAGREQQEANADRIVACVNACAGIEDPAELRRQRDELLDALTCLRNRINECSEHPEISASECYDSFYRVLVDAAIENATKGTK